jgi:hypothetical protein
MTKISKAQAGYTFHPDVAAYVCGGCVFEKDANGKDFCALIGPSVAISEETGSCNSWMHGEPEEQKIEVPWFSIATKQQLGYDENRVGFSCKRCSNFIVGSNDCLRVYRNSPGDTPGIISPDACCSLWKKDGWRGSLTTPQLVQVMARSAQKKNGLQELARA